MGYYVYSPIIEIKDSKEIILDGKPFYIKVFLYEDGVSKVVYTETISTYDKKEFDKYVLGYELIDGPNH